jgi:hypothetical protein
MSTGTGTAYYVDPVNGTSTAGGRSPDEAVDSISTAHGLCTANQNDTVYLLPGTSGSYDYLTATLTWSKSYTHLIGLGTTTRVGQRQRVLNAAASTSLTKILSVTASGCIFENVLFGQFGSNAAAIGCVEVTGERNHFENVNFQGSGHATPAAVAGNYSLFLNGGSENTFTRCTIGLDTIVRTDGAPIKLDGSATRNIFDNCYIISACETAAKPMVAFVDASALDRYLIFDNCLFYNFYTNHGGTLNECFTVPASASTHDIILKNCAAVGIAEWAKSDRGQIWVIGGTPAAGTAGSGSTGIAVEPS